MGNAKIVITDAAIVIWQFNDQAIVDQHLEGVIDCCHAEVGQLVFDAVANGFDIRVIMVGNQIIQDHFSLRSNPDALFFKLTQGTF